MISNKQPIESRVQIEYTLVSDSVQRRHPSHYIQEGKGLIYAHPFGKSRKPKIVGEFRFWIVQLFQAYAANVDLATIFTGDLKPVLSLLSSDGQFREDLPLEPCNTLSIMDQFVITDSTYDHETLKVQCLEEFIRTFCYIEITILYQGVRIAVETLNKIGFAKISETDFLLRDNCVYFGGPLVESHCPSTLSRYR